MKHLAILQRLHLGHRRFLEGGEAGDVSAALRPRTAEEGQRPHTVVLSCSDSRAIPERIFSAGIGELFVVRVAGNVLGPQQLGSVEYAVEHLGCDLVLVLGHRGCGAVEAALAGDGHGAVRSITDEIHAAIGSERDPARAERRNVRHAMKLLRSSLGEHGPAVRGAIYDIASGALDWLEDAETL